MRKLLLILIALLIPWQVFATTTLYVDTDAVSPSPPTYSTLAAAVAALPATLADDYVIECSGATADTTPVLITGITTTATNDLTISGNGVGTTGDIDTSKYHRTHDVVSSTPIVSIDIDTDFVTVDSIQIVFTSTTSARNGNRGIYQSNQAGIVVNGCLIDYSGMTGAYTGFSGIDFYISSTITTECSVINNIVVGTSLGDSAIGINLTVGAYRNGTLNAYNNTVYGGVEGIYLEEGPMDAIYTCGFANNIVVGCTTDISIVGTPTFTINDYNISSDATAVGSNSLTNQVANDLMTDPANGDYTLKAGSNAIGAGTDLSAYFTTDITGATRSAPWDIGAFSYAAAATGWAGKIYGITPAKIMGVPVSNISKVGGL